MEYSHLSDLNITGNFGKPQADFTSIQYARGYCNLKGMKILNATDIPLLFVSIIHHARTQRTTVNDKATMKNKDTQRYYLNIENIFRRLINVYQTDEQIVDFPDTNLILYMCADVIQTEESSGGFILSNLNDYVNKVDTEDVYDVDSKLPLIYNENMRLHSQKKLFVTDRINTLNNDKENKSKVAEAYKQITSDFENAATHLMSMLSQLNLDIDTVTDNTSDGFQLLHKICTLSTGIKDLVLLRTNMERVLSSLSLFKLNARLKMLDILFPYTSINSNTGNYKYQKLITYVYLAFKTELDDTQNPIFRTAQHLYTTMKAKLSNDEFTMIDFETFKAEMDRSIQQMPSKLYPISKTTSYASNSSSKSMKKPGEHPFCWMCAYYGRNLNNPHIAKLCKENKTEYKGMAILPNGNKMSDYLATKTSNHPDFGKYPETILKSTIMKDSDSRKKLTSVPKVSGKGERTQ